MITKIKQTQPTHILKFGLKHGLHNNLTSTGWRKFSWSRVQNQKTQRTYGAESRYQTWHTFIEECSNNNYWTYTVPWYNDPCALLLRKGLIKLASYISQFHNHMQVLHRIKADSSAEFDFCWFSRFLIHWYYPWFFKTLWPPLQWSKAVFPVHDCETGLFLFLLISAYCIKEESILLNLSRENSIMTWHYSFVITRNYRNTYHLY